MINTFWIDFTRYAALEAIDRDSKSETYLAAQEVRGLSSDMPSKYNLY